jgi:4-amino-4-deoxy-L-arabinose transferase-like glycosyltransferase
MLTRSWWLLAVLILFLGAGLRFFQLGQIPRGLYWDEQAILVDARSISNTGHDMHNRPWYQVIYPSYGDYKLPVYIWLAGMSSWVFGASAWSIRLPSVMAGLVTIALSGWLVKQIFLSSNKSSVVILANLGQLATMLVVAISPWSMMFSRTAFEGHLGQMLVLISVCCLVMALKAQAGRQKWCWLVAAGAVGSLATYTYFSVRFVWPVVMTLVWWLNQPMAVSKKSLMQATAPWLLGLSVFGLLLLPMLKSPIYGDSQKFRLGTDSVLNNEQQILQSNIYREMAGNTKLDRLFFHRTWLSARELLKNYADHLSFNFLFLTGDSNLRHGTGQHGLFLLVMLPFFLLGLIKLGEVRPQWLVIFFGWWLVALLPASVPDNTPHALRSLNALVPLASMIGIGVAQAGIGIYEYVKKYYRFVTQLGIFGLLLAIILLAHVPFIYHYFKHYPQDSASAWQTGYDQVAESMWRLKSVRNLPVQVISFDDRFYLWLLAKEKPNQVQTWPTRNYQFESFDNFYFGNPTELGPEMILAGRQPQVTEWLTTHQYQVVTQELIDAPGIDSDWVVAEVQHVQK